MAMKEKMVMNKKPFGFGYQSLLHITHIEYIKVTA